MWAYFLVCCSCRFSLSVVGLLGRFSKNLRGVCSFFGSCGRMPIFFAFCGVVPVVFFENVSACFTVLVLCAVGFGSDVGGFGCEFVSFSTVCLAAHVFAVPVFVNHVVVVVGVCP